jgi:hypothetical protein
MIGLRYRALLMLSLGREALSVSLECFEGKLQELVGSRRGWNFYLSAKPPPRFVWTFMCENR